MSRHVNEDIDGILAYHVRRTLIVERTNIPPLDRHAPQTRRGFIRAGNI